MNRIENNTSDTATLLPEPARNNAASPTRNWRVPGDKVMQATASMDEPHRDALRWINGYGAQHNLTIGDVAAKLRKADGTSYSETSLLYALTGVRSAQGSSLEPLVDSIQRLRKVVEARKEITTQGFIETSLSKSIFAVCARALARKRCTFIIGESQIGKTTCLEEYAKRNNHGQTIYVRMPTRGALGEFMTELAYSLNISTQQQRTELRRRLINYFDENILLIVDEAHQCLSSQHSARSAAALEFVREIHDRRKCGVVICGTELLRQGVARGPHSALLSQLRRRAYNPLILPAMLTPSQFAEFAGEFGLAPAGNKAIKVDIRAVNEDGEEIVNTVTDTPSELQVQIVKRHGLGRWIAILQAASDSAKDACKQISWGRVIMASREFHGLE